MNTYVATYSAGTVTLTEKRPNGKIVRQESWKGSENDMMRAILKCAVVGIEVSIAK